MIPHNCPFFCAERSLEEMSLHFARVSGQLGEVASIEMEPQA